MSEYLFTIDHTPRSKTSPTVRQTLDDAWDELQQQPIGSIARVYQLYKYDYGTRISTLLIATLIRENDEH